MTENSEHNIQGSDIYCSLWQGLFNNMPSGAAIYKVINDGSKGSDYIIRDFNKASLKIEGKTREEIIGKSLFDLRPKIDEYGLIPIFKQVWDTGNPGYFPSTVYIDEKYSNWYENWVFKLSTGEIVAIYNDVTGRKQGEQALVQTKLFYESILENVQDGIWVTDKNDIIFYANQAMEKIAGVSCEQIKGKNLLTDFASETTGELVELYKKAKEEKNPVWYDIRVKTPSGRETHQDGWLIPRFNKDFFDGVICTVRDITERRKAEMELAEYRNNLEKLVEQRTAELKKSQSMLFEADKLASIGELGAGVAHELNSPLAGILSLIDFYLKEKDPESREYSDLEEMKKAGKYMSNVISSLNDLARKSTGELVDLDFNQVIEDTLIFSAYRLKHQNITIKKDLDNELHLIRGEKNKLQQIIINMVTNAADAMPQGGIFKIKTKNTGQADVNFIEISFSDNGCGIDNEHIDKIFEPFYTTKRPGRGIGLGLSIVYNIIKEYGGSVQVTSELNKGTEFIIRLPSSESSG